MKIVKAILYLIVILVVILAAAAFFAPGEKHVERSITIDAPASVVYGELANFENWQNWDPWWKKDSTQERNYEGTKGEAGYGYSWKSDHQGVGNGKMTITSLEENKSIVTHMNMEEGQMEFDGGFELEEEDGKTTVTWSMDSKLGFPMKAMHYFTDKMVGPDFEEGLASMKAYIESMPAAPEGTGDMQVEMVTEFGENYAVVRDVVSFAEMDKFYEAAYPMIYDYLRQNGLDARSASRSIYWTWDQENGQSDMAAAVMISDALDRGEGNTADLGVGEASAGDNSLTYIQNGGYGQSMASHTAIGEWMKNNNKEMDGPVIEEYVKGPYDQVDSSEYVTHIIYHFKDAE